MFASVAPGGGPTPDSGVQVRPDDIELIPGRRPMGRNVPDPFEGRLGSASWFVARRNLPWPAPDGAARAGMPKRPVRPW